MSDDDNEIDTLPLPDEYRHVDSHRSQSHMPIDHSHQYEILDKENDADDESKRCLLSEDKYDNIEIPSQNESLQEEHKRHRHKGKKTSFRSLPMKVLAGFLGALSKLYLFGLVHKSDGESIPESVMPFDNAFKAVESDKDFTSGPERLAFIGVWNGDHYNEYLRHFFYTIQLNADTVDLVFINRKLHEDDKCLDFETLKVDVHWGGNVRIVCMENKEWLDRYINFLCSEQYGWNCSPLQRLKVQEEFVRNHPDKRNFSWRLFRGWVFKDLLPQDNPYWAWIDHDLHVGRLTQFPFKLIKNLSMVSFQFESVYKIFLAGQLTAFNFRDPDLPTAWHKIAQLSSVDRFLEGNMPEADEEQLWSWEYLQSSNDRAGSNLSYALLPDLNGDDHSLQDGQIFAISGRDIVKVEAGMSRLEIEAMILLERESNIDQFEDIGWTAGNDGSNRMLVNHNISMAVSLRQEKENGYQGSMFDGILQTVQFKGGDSCSEPYWVEPQFRMCVDQHPLSMSRPRALRSSIVRLKKQEPGYVFQRFERDRRPRAYSRSLFKHHHRVKDWLEFPSFEITENLIFTVGLKEATVFRIGPSREEIIYLRKKDGTGSIG